PPDPIAVSLNNTGRGPNENSLPFENAGFAINNELNSFAVELNSRSNRFVNRALFSYNRFRDFRDPFSRPFPTLEIAEDGITYTTLGHEPFSINNLVDQDVWQFMNNFSLFSGNHVLTFGTNFEVFSFNRSFNLFYHGLFFLPVEFGGTAFSSIDEFFEFTDPDSPNFRDFNAEVQEQLQNPFKFDETNVGQLAFYAQDEFSASENFSLTYGLRLDFPMYFTDLPRNRFSTTLTLLDENDRPETVDAGEFPGVKVLFSPRIGFNWDLFGDRSTQVRGGTGIFTGRLPFVWIGNTVSNQGPEAEFPSFDINATDTDFKWPQVWTTDLAVDQQLPLDMLGTLELIYGNDINAVFVRNADLGQPVRTLPIDGRPYFGGMGNNKLNPEFAGGVYVLDNTGDGHLFNLTATLRKRFDFGLNTSLAYSFLEAKNQLSSTETSSFLWQRNPVQGDPNNPEVSFSEFGKSHRIVGAATYSQRWSKSAATHFGLFLEIAQGAPFTAAGLRSRFSYVYVGDVNGDGADGNDLIYIPRNADEINFAPILDENGNVISTPGEQWQAFDAFIEQDDYLRSHRGQIAERNGAINPWFSDVDIRMLQNFSFNVGGQKHTFQLSLDILNVLNMIDSDWGVRQVPNSGAKSPLVFTGEFDENGAPIFQFPGIATETFLDDVGINSRWRAQFGIRYLFN
ncbi:TonB-dependent receptor, partial [candidate division KSB1 bacterium]|nr:TonB-dependent receptor [candidate division KSB1 bacterium]NIR69675.1 TonB-dependent receptor [candidate division KSB1 bacterium]NIS25749.1 TonB-dependent receptor [candidate division KSB1 bacterium]NIT72618.1 TonB-dependent receptor [candidate division KSB1 bacterium]NIU26430.1 TonB-dependent receptor [candidate division KSB1 bacterium]